MIKQSGIWQFRLDPSDIGESEHWEQQEFTQTIEIPGILQAQGYGDKITKNTEWVQSLYDRRWYDREEYRIWEKLADHGTADEREISVPFLCQPPRHYTGKAWYRTTFCVKGEKNGWFYRLFMECTRWKTTAWVDGIRKGSAMGLCAPHEIDLGCLTAGEHVLTVCVDNGWQLPYRPDGHGVSDALGVTWNGMVGAVVLQEKPPVELHRMELYPDAGTMCVRVKLTVENHTDQRQNVGISVCPVCRKNLCEHGDNIDWDTEWKTEQVWAEPGTNYFERMVFYPQDTLRWDEFTPHLERIAAKVTAEDILEADFGFRTAETKDGLFQINGRPTYFRGTHFGGDYPETGYPRTDAAFWDNMMQVLKKWGLNFIRMHSYCPPEAAFEAADRAGIYLQIECGMWNNFTPGAEMTEILNRETERILQAFGNHPSFVLFSPSNEPGKRWPDVLLNWVSEWKKKDGRRLYTAQSGWPYPQEPKDIDGVDYVYFHRSGYGIEPGGTIRGRQGWNGRDYRKSLEGIRYPVICHELGQWCSYPDFQIIDRMDGYLQPGSYRIYREIAKEHGVLEQNPEFVFNSGRLQTAMYKEDLEANFRTPHMYGFELLDLHDYLGQGSALVGVLNTYWEEKGYVSAKEWREFCGPTVILARIPKKVYTTDETFSCTLELCHFGSGPLTGKALNWSFEAKDGEILQKGHFDCGQIPIGKGTQIGEVAVSLRDAKREGGYIFRTWLTGKGNAGTVPGGIPDADAVTNYWNLWIYQAGSGAPAAGVVETENWEEALQELRDGKRVVFYPPLASLGYENPSLRFYPVFWNAQMGPSYARGMGLVCRKDHPALAGFETEAWGGWQWEEIMEHAKGICMEQFPKELKPIVQPIDDWNRSLRLGMVVECKVGAGSLLFVSAELKPNGEKRPAAAALRQSLLTYARSDAFSPEVSISEEMLLGLRFHPSVMKQWQVSAVCSDRDGVIDADLTPMLEGNPEQVFRAAGRYPFTIEFTMPKPHRIEGLVYMPRQNERQHEGDICGYCVEVWEQDGWKMAAEGKLCSSFAPKTIRFAETKTADRIRFTVRSGFASCEETRWISKEDGWYREYRSDWPDIFSAAAIVFLTDELLKEEQAGDGQPVHAGTATKEIQQG